MFDARHHLAIPFQGRPRAAAVFAVLLAAILAGCVTPHPMHSEATTAIAGEAEVVMKDLKFSPRALTVAVGTTLTWTNDDPFPHTVTPTDGSWGTDGSDTMQRGDTWSHTFDEPGTFDYHCIPHASKGSDGSYRGMTGSVVVVASAAPAAASSGGDPAASVRPAPPAALPVDVAEIGADALAVPPRITRTAPANVTFELTSKEVVAEMADGKTYAYWTFDGQVPGPMLRVREGDTVTIVHHNDASSTMSHNIDFHAVTGPGGGAEALTAAPGETARLTFLARHAGVFSYHCADATPPVHIAQGMYGLIVVEPQDGLRPVDREFYVVEGDFYSGADAAKQGHHAYSSDRAAAELADWVVFNGRVGSLTGARQMEADVGETVRIWFGVGGPNRVSSFHVIGEVFDKVYAEGSLISPPRTDVQTTLVPAGGATMVEFGLEVPGNYVLVDHSINRVLQGAAGILHVEGEARPGVFGPGP